MPSSRRTRTSSRGRTSRRAILDLLIESLDVHSFFDRRPDRSKLPYRRTMFEQLDLRALLATVTWDGGAGTLDWNDTDNWDTNTLPGVGDDAVIPDLSGTPSIATTAAVSIHSVTSQEDLAITAGSFRANGTVNGDLANLATLAPGNSPGCITVNGSYTETAASTLEIELQGLTQCTEYDALLVNGPVTLAGTLNVSLLGGFAPTAGDTFTIIANDGIDAVSGTFAGLPEGAGFTSGGARYAITYRGGDGNDVVLSAFTRLVTNTGDSGAGSLRQAILEANADSTLDVIAFNIPGTGPHTISPAAALPQITAPVTIDGYTQSGASPNSLLVGSDTVLKIELDGSSAGGTPGLRITAGGSTVRGLVINRFAGAGVILSSLGSNVLEGNYIGTDVTGTVARGNATWGVLVIGAPDNLVGGNTLDARNVIAGNLQGGVAVYASGADDNLIQGNYIGVDASGTIDLGNAFQGVFTGDGAGFGSAGFATGTRIGGTTPAERNVIAGNNNNGIWIKGAGASDNLVQGNYIGLNAAGTAAVGNTFWGVGITDAPNNTIGGLTTLSRNLISGNLQGGVYAFGSNTTGLVIQNNWIGVDVTGTADLGNAFSGVYLGDFGQTLGSANGAVVRENVISGNNNFGVWITAPGSDNHQLLGNYIGTDFTGSVAVGNSLDGVQIDGGAAGNVVGGGTAGAGNIISGNTIGGIDAITAPGTVVQGNYIGTDVTGTIAVANGTTTGSHAVRFSNFAGGLIGTNGDGVNDEAEGNLVSGNAGNGIRLQGGSGSFGSHVVAGNLIGVYVTGNSALANGAFGISVLNSENNRIGTDANSTSDALEANVISGNASAGIDLFDNSGVTSTIHNVIAGNFIGTNRTGTMAIANSLAGVQIRDAESNTVGGASTAARNVISGTAGDGVVISGSGSTGNVVLGNFIGPNSLGSGTPAPSGAVAWWMAEGDASDPVGGYDGTLKNGVTFVTGKSGQGFQFDGVDDQVDVGDRLDVGTSDFTIEAWIKGDPTMEGWGRILDKGFLSGFTFGRVANTGFVGFEFLNSGSQGNTFGTTSVVIDNQWHHVAVTKQGTTARIYADGVLENTQTVSSASQDNSLPLLIGYNPGEGTQGHWKGLVDELAVYHRALSDSEIQRIALVGGAGKGAGNLGLAGVVIRDGATDNVIGGDAPTERNVISGNDRGVAISGATATGNTIAGNYIGTDATGLIDVGNFLEGIRFDNGTTGNTIGGAAAGTGNVISGNNAPGIVLFNAGANNLIAGNIVGLGSDGTTIVRNNQEGISLANTSGTTIGGTVPAARNVVSGNSFDGIALNFASSNTLVVGNYLGTDITGTLDRGNGNSGILMANGSDHNTIGGTTAAERNVISGNNFTGAVHIVGAHDNTVLGNFIGTSADGTSALGNHIGVQIEAGSTGNTIGGTTPGARNVISGNTDGVRVGGVGTTGNVIEGNLIGVDGRSTPSGATAWWRAENDAADFYGANHGSLVNGGFADGKVGRAFSFDGDDYVSVPYSAAVAPGTGSFTAELWVQTTLSNSPIIEQYECGGSCGPGAGGSWSISVFGGKVNTGMRDSGLSAQDLNGSTSINDGAFHHVAMVRDLTRSRFELYVDGVLEAQSPLTVTGNVGDADGENDPLTIGYHRPPSVNPGDASFFTGLVDEPTLYSRALSAAEIATIHAMDSAGKAGFTDLGNTQAGVRIENAASNTIGGATAGSRNIVSGNTLDGISVLGAGSTGNFISGNYVGTDPSGTADLGNDYSGVAIETLSSANTINNNLISGNAVRGIDLSGDSNVVQGNLVGTDVTGLLSIPNVQVAVDVFGNFNQIGGTTVAARNVIAGNTGTGIHLNTYNVAGTHASNNIVQGNYVGVNAAGTAALRNGGGVFVGAGANNLIGGTSAGAGNLISSPTWGVLISGSTAAGNVVQGNLIGTNAAGSAVLGNGNDGVALDGGAHHNLIGGTAPGARNVISGSSDAGVEIDSEGTTNNVVAGNYIGTDVTGTIGLGNNVAGIRIQLGASSNTIGGTTPLARNVISSNNGNGIEIMDSSSGNMVLGNLIGVDGRSSPNGAVSWWRSEDAAQATDFYSVNTGTFQNGATIAANGKVGSTLSFNGIDAGVVIANNGTLSPGAGDFTIEAWIKTSAANGGVILMNYGGVGLSNYNLVVDSQSHAGVHFRDTAGNELLFSGTSLLNDGQWHHVVGLRKGASASIFVDGALEATQSNPSFGSIVSTCAYAKIGGTYTGLGNCASADTSEGNFNGLIDELTFYNRALSAAEIATIHAMDSAGKAGFTDLGNATNGVAIGGGATANTIGGLTATPGAGSGNVISGNNERGIAVFGADGNSIRGNIVGLNAAGSAVLPNNFQGIEIVGTGNIVGGSTAGARNVISGNNGGFGGIFLQGGGSSIVQGNFIGTDITGTIDLGNAFDGIQIRGSSNNTIGGTTPLARNAIAGNNQNGVQILPADNFFGLTAPAENNVVLGNLIGVDGRSSPTGAVAWLRGEGDAADFYGVNTGTFRNGVATAAGKVGSAFTFDGVDDYVEIPDSASLSVSSAITIEAWVNPTVNTDQVIATQYDTGPGGGGQSWFLSSGADGRIYFFVYSSASVHRGIATDGPALSAGLWQHVAATFDTATQAIKLYVDGAEVPSGLIAGSTSTVSAIHDSTSPVRLGTVRPGSGVLNSFWSGGIDEFTIYGRALSAVEIATIAAMDSAGKAGFTDLGNAERGVWISNGATGNTIGGAAVGARNIISGNTQYGIELSASSNTVQGNYIGTDASGTAAIGNNRGIGVFSLGNLIGTNGDGTLDDAERNVISGNPDYGVLIISGGNNRIAGNYIGTDATGTTAVSGSNQGVAMFSTSGNIVGTDGSNDAFNAHERNIISGHSNRAVILEGPNVVAGNYIGLDVTGTAAIGNFTGIQVTGTGARVGSNADGIADDIERNVISGSYGPDGGIVVRDATTTGAVIAGNYIGTNAAGTAALGNNTAGVQIILGAHGNTIGGTQAAERNLISGNTGAGVAILGDSTVVFTDNFNGYFGGNQNANQPGTGLALSFGGNLPGWSKAGFNAVHAVDQGGGNYAPSFFHTDSIALGSSISANTLGHQYAVSLDVGPSVYSVGEATLAADGIVVTILRADSSVLATETILPGAWIDGPNAQHLSNHSFSYTGDGSGDVKIVISTNNPGSGRFGGAIDNLQIREFTTRDNVVQGNYIGTNATGTGAVGNAADGIRVSASTNNIIGGTATGAGNLISGNAGSGILLGDLSYRNRVQGNYIGTNASGSEAISNQDGVRLASGSTNNTIGDTTADARNVISGNDRYGVIVTGSGTSNNQLQGNYIGVNAAGAAALGNRVGVKIDSSRNTVGGSSPAERNVVSGNYDPTTATGTFGTGIWIHGGDASGNVVAGNYVGVAANGSSPIGNGDEGVLIDVGATNNTVGGLLAGSGNLISANRTAGVHIYAASSNLVVGNLIGTDATGTIGLGGQAVVGAIALRAGSTNNVIGGTTSGERNLVSGNSAAGIFISGSHQNSVLGNFIGTNIGGAIAVPNGGAGIVVANGATDNTIGGGVSGAGNVVSGNARGGVVLDSAPSSTLQGNRIGTNAGGNAALPNTGPGVQVSGDSAGNIIGGFAAGQGNLISGNNGDGIQLTDHVDGSIVAGNLIGTEVTGTADLGNTGVGVRLASGFFDGAQHVTIGGDDDDDGAADGVVTARNTISGNDQGGIRVEGSMAGNNTIAGNFIGVDANGSLALANTGSGVAIVGSSFNTIGGVGAGAGNTIAFNNNAGVTVIGGSTGNRLRGNSIHSNTGLGIDLGADGVAANDSEDGDSGPNELQNFPVLSTPLAGALTRVSGQLDSTPNTTFAIDFFASSAPDPSGFGEGKRYLGSISVATDGSGTALFDQLVAGVTVNGDWITAVVTDPAGNSSEFSGAVQAFSNTPPTIDESSLILTDISAGDGFGVPSQVFVEGSLVRLDGLFINLDPDDTHTVVIHWGDGSPSTTLSVDRGARGFSGEHRYTDDQPTGTTQDDYTIEIFVTDDDNSSGVATIFVTIANAVATLDELSLLPSSSGLEGETRTLSGTFIDSGDDQHRLLVQWGDGSPTQTVYLPRGERNFAIPHQFLDEATGISVTLIDDDTVLPQTPDTRSLAVEIANAPPVPFFAAPATLTEGTPLNLLGTAVDPGAGDIVSFTWVVSRNGAPVLETPGANLTFTPTNEGVYTFLLIASDELGASASFARNMTVTNVTPTVNTGSFAITALGGTPALTVAPEGKPIELHGSFFDPGTDDSHVVTIHWGDGSGLTTLDLALGQTSFVATHVYADDGISGTSQDSYPVTVSVHDGLDTGVGNSSIVVANTAPLVEIADNGSDDTTIRLRAAVRDDSNLDTFNFAWSVSGPTLPVGTSLNQPTLEFPRTTGLANIGLTVTDDDLGATTATATIVLGSDVADVISIGPSATPGDVTIEITTGGNSTTVEFTPSGVTLVLAQGDDDTITVDSLLTVPVVIDGGGGNDDIAGGVEGDTIIGGPGNDSISSGDGADVVDISQGDDTVDSGLGDDVIRTFGFSNKTIIDNGGIDTLDFSGVRASSNPDEGVTLNLALTAGQIQAVRSEGSISLTGTFENVVGTNFNDHLTGNDEDNLIFGGSGSDTIQGGGGRPTISGGSGNDMIFGGATSDGTLDGDDGDDTIFGGSGTDTVQGGGGRSTIRGGGGNDMIFGGTGGDATLDGGLGDDSIQAGSGSDMIFGGAGSDTIQGGGGRSSISGGSGNDKIFSGQSGYDSIDGGEGDDSIVGGGGNDLIFGQESLAGGEGNDTIFGGTHANSTIDGGLGDDSIRGGDGNDLIFGGSGSDTVQGGGGRTTIRGGSGNDMIFAGTGDGTLDGELGDDSIQGGDGDDLLFGGSGSDTVRGGGGRTTIRGGSGNDMIFAGSSTDGTLDGEEGDDLIQGGQGDGLIFGGSGSDTVQGGGGRTTIRGGRGNDMIFAGTGITEIDGEDDDDSIVAGTGDGVIFGGSGSDTVQGGGGRTTIRGGRGNDMIFGGGVTEIDGEDDNDSIVAGTGDALIFGGSGSDTVQGGGGRTTIRGGSGNDMIFAGTGLMTDIDGEDDDDSIVAGMGDALIFGGSGSDTVQGGGGRTTIRGGRGNDMIFGGSGVTDIDGEDDDDSILGGTGEESIFGGSGNDTIQGGGGRSTIRGGSGNDMIFGGSGGDSTLSGGGGRDSIRGGRGNDMIFGDEEDDTIVASSGDDSVDGGDGNDLVYGEVDTNATLSSQQLTIVGKGTATFFGIESAWLTGSDADNTFDATATSLRVLLDGRGGNDVLLGGSGNDLLIGGPGNNTLRGAAGNDTYAFDGSIAGANQVDESTGSGEDTLDFVSYAGPIIVDLGSLSAQQVAPSLSMTLSGEIENVFGSEFSDVILGNSLDNKLYGLGGEDYLLGGPGNDTLAVGLTRIVFLDFDSETELGEHVYPEPERAAILARMRADYAMFDIQFTEVRPASGPFVTVLFNAAVFSQSSARLIGGVSDRIGWRELGGSGVVRVDVNGFLGEGSNKLPGTEENFIALSSTIGSHELGHFFGVRHHDAFGAPGTGVYDAGNLRQRIRPTYTGPAAAVETRLHLLASPASVGTTLIDALGNPFLGERESIKLAFGENGHVVAEQPLAGKTGALSINGLPVAVQELGQLPALSVPNMVEIGVNAGRPLDVGAINVLGSIDLVGTVSESDYYSFPGRAGDVVTIEVLSQGLRHRIQDVIDSVVRVYNSAGQKVAYYGSSLGAFNDDLFEPTDSLILDLVLPADDVYTIEVDAFSIHTPEFPSYVAGFDIEAFSAENPDSELVTDRDTGRYELFLYRVNGSTVPQFSGGDTVIGGAGADTLIGNSGRETIVGFKAGEDTFRDPFGSAFQTTFPPSLEPIGDRTVIESDVVRFVAVASDLDGDPIHFRLEGIAGTTFPEGATIDSQSGQFTFNSRDDGLFSVRVVAEDSAGGMTFEEIDILVLNAPPTADAGSDTTATEGTPVTLTGAFTDAGSADTHTVAWVISGPNGFEVTGTELSITFTPPDNGVYHAAFTVTDDDGGSHSDDLIVDVRNGIPTITTLNVTAAATPGRVHLAAEFTDPGIRDTHTASVSWGDGVVGSIPVSQLAGGGTIAGDYTYAASGNYTITLTVTDDDGDVTSRSMSVAVTVEPPGGEITVVDGELRIIGTSDADTIRVYETLGKVIVTASFLPAPRRMVFPTAVVNRIDIQGGLGDDSIDVSSLVLDPARILGGDGNDILNGGNGPDTIDGGAGHDTIHGREGADSIRGGLDADTIYGDGGDDTIRGDQGADLISGGKGNDIVLGGAGNDTIQGAEGRDLLIGGFGADFLRGNAGDDILIAGYTTHDDHTAALIGILREWTSGRDYTTRVNNIKGTGTGTRLNGNDFLQTDVTVLGDSAADRLLGDSERDWFFASLADTVENKASNEIIGRLSQ